MPAVSRYPSGVRTALIALVSASLAACSGMPGQPAAGASTAGTGGAATTPGCESLPLSNTTKTVIGTVIGGVIGYGIGNATGGGQGKSRNIGVLAGALAGGLASSAFKNDIDVEQQDDGSVRLKIPGKIMFASGQSSLSQGFQSTLANVTTTIKKYCGITVRVVGHTDSIGSLGSNMTLSENRAKSVVGYMQTQGFDRARMTFEGRGPNEPVATNADEVGRQQNRRVEIFIKPPTS